MMTKKSFLKAATPLALAVSMAASSTTWAEAKYDVASLEFPHVENELLVVYKDSSNIAGAMSSLYGLGAVDAAVISKFKNNADSVFSRTVQVEFPGDLAKVMEIIAQDPSVAYVEPNYIVSIDSAPNDTYFDELWGLHNTGQTGGTDDADIDAIEAWEIETGEKSVVVGVLDTGVAYNHKDLRPTRWVNTGEIKNNGIDDDGNGYIDDKYGINCITDSGNPYDDQGHGTHVAGTIAAAMNNSKGIAGVAPGVSIMALKFLSAEGSGSTADAAQCLEYAIEMGATLTNNSWGGGAPSLTMRDAIVEANVAGQLFVAAAGNDGTDNDVIPHFPSNYGVENVLSVANTTHTDELAPSSNFGISSVDIAAPGSNILSTVPYSTVARAKVINKDGPDVIYDGLRAAESAEGKAQKRLKDGGLCTSEDPSFSDKIVVCQRGEISFLDKVMNVQNSGGRAVVIYNNVEGPLNATLGEDNESTIPTITLTQEEGAALVAEEGKVGKVVAKFNSKGLGYDSYTGTSMASPHVAGGAALLLSVDPTLTPVQLKNILMNTADTPAALDGKVASNGRMNVRAALDSLSE